MISNLFMINASGDVIIEKQFQEKMARSSLEAYWSTYIDPLPRLEDVPNVIQFSTYAHVQIVRDGVLFLGVTAHEAPPMMVLEVLNLMANTLHGYIKSLDEQSLRDNFSLVYQLLEEMVHNGFPLTTETHLLEDLVPKSSLETRVKSMLDKATSSGSPREGGGSSSNAFNPNSLEGGGGAATTSSSSPYSGISSTAFSGGGGAVGIAWRAEGVKYTANELLFDVTEYMDVVMDADGGVVRYNVRGQIDCISRLGGMPEVNVRMSGIEGVEDIGFHRCVRHSQYESSRMISFVPPDGPFTLCNYRCKPQQYAANAPNNRHGVPQILPPFYTNPQVSFYGNAGRVTCMVGLRGANSLGSTMPGDSTTSARKEVSRVVVTIPLPASAESIAVTNCNYGTYAFDSHNKRIVWKLPHIPSATSSTTPSFTCTVALNPQQQLASSAIKSVAGGGVDEVSGDQDQNPIATMLAADRNAASLTDKVKSGSSKRKKKEAAAEAAAFASDANATGAGAIMYGTGEPVSVSFLIMNHSLSDMRIDNVDISNVKYKPYKAVRYMTKGGRFLIRTV
jgi:AP-3 complex subunit mu